MAGLYGDKKGLQRCGRGRAHNGPKHREGGTMSPLGHQMMRLLSEWDDAEKDISAAALRSGRDGVAAVLMHYLDARVARERANNIAQALLTCGDDPIDVTREMLRHTVRESRIRVAEEVVRAWRAGIAR